MLIQLIKRNFHFFSLKSFCKAVFQPGSSPCMSLDTWSPDKTRQVYSSLTMRPSGTVSSQEFAVLLGRKQSISRLCLLQVKPPRLKTQTNASLQFIVNPQCQFSVSSECVLVPTAARGVVSCPWFSMCLFGRCWSTERSFDFASLSCQKPSSSLFICWNVTMAFINLSLLSMVILLKSCFSHSLMTVTHRGQCFCLCWVLLHLKTFRWALSFGVAAGGTGWGWL